MNNDSKINRLILKSAYALIIALIIVIIGLLILKYNVEGEKNMPFNLSSILLISGAEGYQQVEKEDYNFDVEIYQNNDIYLNIEKNKKYKETEKIKSIKIENIEVQEKPQVGNIAFYRTSNEKSNLFKYEEEFEIKEEIEYLGEIQTDLSNFQVSNQGGTIIVRVVNKTGRKYSSNEGQIEHNGKLLDKIGISYDEIKFKITFDLVINLESGISFRSNIKIDFPSGNIIKEGSSNIEIKDMSNIIFKREQE